MQQSKPDAANGQSSLWAPVRTALLATAGVSLVARALPNDWAATGVSACFFGLCYFLVLRHPAATVATFGLSLGGLFEPAPLNFGRMLRETGTALGWALALSAVCFPLFWLGYLWWWEPKASFVPTINLGIVEDIAGHVLVVALPEEMFYRGYLQTALDQARPPRKSWFKAKLGLGLVLSSAIFALGHVATEPHFARLSVFFPSLLFGWLRTRTGGIGASVFFHALCNLFAAFLGRSYGLFP